MNVDRVPSLDPPLSPESEVWSDFDSVRLSMRPTPLTSIDTSQYVRDTITEGDVGAVESLGVAVIRDEYSIAVRLSWEDATRDDELRNSTDFVDKAAVAFPVKQGASVMTMGSDQAPMNAWYWRADRGEPYDVIAKGFGRTERREPSQSGLTSVAEYGDDRWQVVFARPLFTDERDYVDLRTSTTGIAFAVWDGDNAERGPLKSYSGEFRRLALE